MKTLLLGLCVLALATCKHSPSFDSLQLDEVRGNGLEAMSGSSSQESLANETQSVSYSQIDIAEEGVESCLEFKEIAAENWRDDTLGTLIYWESDIVSFESFVEEAQCMLGKPWAELEEILGSNYRNPKSKYDEQRYGDKYYWIQLAVLTPIKNKAGKINRLRLYVKCDEGKQIVREIIQPISSYTYIEYD